MPETVFYQNNWCGTFESQNSIQRKINENRFENTSQIQFKGKQIKRDSKIQVGDK